MVNYQVTLPDLMFPPSEWRREALRTNLWVVPLAEVVGAIALFAITAALDRAF